MAAAAAASAAERDMQRTRYPVPGTAPGLGSEMVGWTDAARPRLDQARHRGLGNSIVELRSVGRLSLGTWLLGYPERGTR